MGLQIRLNGGMRSIDACLYVRPSDRTTLERLVADGKTPQKIVARARVVLLSGRGFGTNSIQREARVSKPTVGAGRKPTWMVASSACSRTGARARAPARSRS